MSSSSEKLAARVPQRERGRRRVESLIRAAVALFAEKGYDAATMTEVAERAGAPIGSLYQFFPNKEALADAVLERIGALLDDALIGIEARVSTITVAELVEALLGVLVGFEQERAAATTLIESRQVASARAAELKLSRRRRIARILRGKIPKLSPKRAEVMAAVVIQLMKAAVGLRAESEPGIRDSVLRELRDLMGLYINDKMGRSSFG
jgi:AcrR family transcriptional regulator